MITIHKEENVNKFCIAIVWVCVIVVSYIQYFTRQSVADCFVVFAVGLQYIIPTILFVIRKDNKLIKYFVIVETILYTYIIMYIQNGLFDNIYFLFLAIVATSVYFDVKLTIFTTLSLIFTSIPLYIWFKPYFFPIHDIDNFIAMLLVYVIMGLIISLQTFWSKSLVRSQKNLYTKAIKDNLTDTYNRTYFEYCFDKIIERFKANDKPLSLILLDIDNFKNVNDTYGHLKGDLVLQEVAKDIVLFCSYHDIIARIGGEEFIVILENTQTNEASIFAEKIRETIENNIIENIKVTVSIGITSLTGEDTPDSFFERVDQALYQAKKTGKNCIVIK